jgi:hypothetical protein
VGSGPPFNGLFPRIMYSADCKSTAAQWQSIIGLAVESAGCLRRVTPRRKGRSRVPELGDVGDITKPVLNGEIKSEAAKFAIRNKEALGLH